LKLQKLQVHTKTKISFDMRGCHGLLSLATGVLSGLQCVAVDTLDMSGCQGLVDLVLPPTLRIDKLMLNNCAKLRACQMRNASLRFLSLQDCPVLSELSIACPRLLELDVRRSPSVHYKEALVSAVFGCMQLTKVDAEGADLDTVFGQDNVSRVLKNSTPHVAFFTERGDSVRQACQTILFHQASRVAVPLLTGDRSLQAVCSCLLKRASAHKHKQSAASPASPTHSGRSYSSMSESMMSMWRSKRDHSAPSTSQDLVQHTTTTTTTSSSSSTNSSSSKGGTAPTRKARPPALFCPSPTSETPHTGARAGARAGARGDVQEREVEVSSGAVDDACVLNEPELIVRVLELSCPPRVKIGPVGVAALAQMLTIDISLFELHLHSLLLGDYGTKEICSALLNNTKSSVCSLSLAGSNITDAGVQALATLLHSNRFIHMNTCV
jgi:hypothetical protein